MKKLDLDLDRKVIINMDTREVIDLSGIRVNEEVFYKLGDIPGYEFYAVEYVNKNNEGPTFNVIISKINSVWKITIDNIEYNSNVTESTLSYKLSTSDNWINMGNSKIFTVTETGEYDIKLTDAAGNETIIKKQIG